MNVEELKELLEDMPSEATVMVDVSQIEDEHEYDIYYDVVDIDINPISTTVYIVTE